MELKTKDREAAKIAFRSALAVHGGDTKNQLVLEALEKLESLNPTEKPAHSPLLEGDWLLISSPNFPGGQQRSDGKFVYTLGRLAFNMFQPVELSLVINCVKQPVIPLGEGEKSTYNIVIEFETIDESQPPLQGIVKNLGWCCPSSDKTLKVQFTGGELAPLATLDTEAMKTWLSVFGSQTQPVNLSIFDRFKFLVAKIMFGLERSGDMDKKTGKVSFSMAKSPQGTLEVLYLDEELRITRGNRGSVVVCERK